MRRVCPVAALVLLSSLTAPVFAARHANWIEVRSSNFTVVSDAGEKQARKTALQFERIRTIFRQSIPGAALHPTPLVTVLAAKDEASMRDLLPEYWELGRAHPAGILVGRFNLYYAAVNLKVRGSTPYENLYHEYFHAITIPAFPDRPVWLAEGLAEYFGHTEFEGSRAEIGKADPNLIALLRDHSLIPLDQLFRVDRYSPYYNEANKTNLFYAESWALTHYLLVGDGEAHKPMLSAYLEALKQGKTSSEAAAAAFGDLKTLQDDLQRYIEHSSFPFEKLPLSEAIDTIHTSAHPLSEAESDAYRAGLAVLRNRTDDAKSLLKEALRLDGDVALTYQYLSLTQSLAGQRERALESVSKAISLDPNNSFTCYFRAYLATTGGGMKSGNSSVEEDLRRAISLSPEFAPSYSLLAVYLATVEHNLPEALSLAEKAISFEPENVGYQLPLGQVLAKMQKWDDADLAAARATAWARDAEDKKNAASFKSYLQRLREDRDDEDIDLGATQSRSSPNVEAETVTKTNSTGPQSMAAVGEESSSASPGRGLSLAPLPVQMQTSISILSDSFGFNFTPYLKRFLDAVREHLASNVNQDLVTRQRDLALDFVILKDGKIAALRIASSSGDIHLDQASRDGVADCSPLPVLPINFKGNYLKLHLGLTYSPYPSR